MYMARFRVVAGRADGSAYKGERDAPDRRALMEELKAEGLTPLSVSVGRKRLALGSFNITLFTHIPSAEKIVFARNLSAMSEAGLSVTRALQVLEKQTKNVGMKKVIHGVLDDVTRGSALHEAFAKQGSVFPKLFIAMTRAGEESGTLGKSLAVVGTQMERSYQLTKKIRGAMIYPAVVITVMLIVFVLMLMFVVPTLASTFADLHTELPASTQFLLNVSAFVVSQTVALVAGIVLAAAALVAAVKSAPGKHAIDWGLFHLPVIGPLVGKIQAARTARTLSSLLSAGVAALTSLEITGEVVGNSLFRPVIARAGALVEKGKPISEAFTEAENIYPVMFAEMAAVGEETGDLSAMLERVADFYEQEVEQQTKDLSTIVEPLLMVLIGGGVGFFAIAMIAPIYSLSGSI